MRLLSSQISSFSFVLPCPGLLCHFLSLVGVVVRLCLIVFRSLASCIHSPSVSVVLCELLNVMVVCGFWL